MISDIMILRLRDYISGVNSRCSSCVVQLVKLSNVMRFRLVNTLLRDWWYDVILLREKWNTLTLLH